MWGRRAPFPELAREAELEDEGLLQVDDQGTVPVQLRRMEHHFLEHHLHFRRNVGRFEEVQEGVLRGRAVPSFFRLIPLLFRLIPRALPARTRLARLVRGIFG